MTCHKNFFQPLAATSGPLRPRPPSGASPAAGPRPCSLCARFKSTLPYRTCFPLFLSFLLFFPLPFLSSLLFFLFSSRNRVTFLGYNQKNLVQPRTRFLSNFKFLVETWLNQIYNQVRGSIQGSTKFFPTWFIPCFGGRFLAIFEIFPLVPEKA